MPKSGAGSHYENRLDSGWDQIEAIKDGVFRRTGVVKPAATAFFKSVPGIKCTRSPVGLAHFQKHRLTVCFAGAVEQGGQKLRGQAFPAEGGSDDEVFQFPVGANVV